LSVEGNGRLVSMTGMNNLESIDGNLSINANDSLVNLNGLNTLTAIEGDLNIRLNNSLVDLTGLEHVALIDGDVLIENNDSLLSLEGLEGLERINGKLEIEYNPSLISLSGLDSLQQIGSSLEIISNPELVNLTGLGQMDTIGGSVQISGNNSLVSLEGLKDEVFMNSAITIGDNENLSTCNITALCNYMMNPGWFIRIYNNSQGCNNTIQVATGCGGGFPCLPYGEYHFTCQEDIDNFMFAFPDCHELEGGVSISGEDIVNLEGLGTVTSMEGLAIYDNDLLADLTGLESVTNIDFELSIKNNDSLQDIWGLNNATIGGEGEIINNDNLSECAIQGVCEILSTNHEFYISDNAPGCNSVQEVDSACFPVYIPEHSPAHDLTIFPNPVSNRLNINFQFPTTSNSQFSSLRMVIINSQGIPVLSSSINPNQVISLDVSKYPSGVYLVRVGDGNFEAAKKVLLAR
jgi:hypothetical protein